MGSDQIDKRAVLDEALRGERFLLFKHSHRCGISSHAFGEYTAFIDAHPELETGWIDVVEDRPLSKRVADRTGIAHESPQALWIVDGKVAWHASHFDITAEALEAAVVNSRNS